MQHDMACKALRHSVGLSKSNVLLLVYYAACKALRHSVGLSISNVLLLVYYAA